MQSVLYIMMLWKVISIPMIYSLWFLLSLVFLSFIHDPICVGFVKDVKSQDWKVYASSLSLSPCGCTVQFSQGHLFKFLPLFQCITFAIFQRSVNSIYMALFMGYLFCFIKPFLINFTSILSDRCLIQHSPPPPIPPSYVPLPSCSAPSIHPSIVKL